jgi:putative ABC transport system permease protein
MVKLAANQILRYGLQSSLAVIGMAIAVANIIMLLSITDLGRSQTMGVINDLGANVLVVMPFVEADSGAIAHMMSSFSSRTLPMSYADAVLQLDEIKAVAPVISLPAHIGYGSERAFATVLGVTVDFPELRGFGAASGTWLTESDIDSAARVALLGPAIAETLFGEEAPQGEQVVIKGERFTVQGLMESKGRVGMEDLDSLVVMPITTAHEIFGIEGFHGMLARHVPGVEPEAAARASRAALDRLVPEGQEVDELVSVLTIKEATNLMDSTLAIFRVVLAGIASIALVVGGIGIMNVMLIRVLQRRLEIGIRLAAGASQRDLRLQFMIESALLAVAGTVAGVVLGIVGVFVYCAFADWRPYVSPITVAGAALFCLAAGLVFGIAPAVRASRTDPVECLRSEV